MKISLSWLNEYVDVSDFLKSPEGLCQKLTSAGLEVESVTDLGKPFANVVIGQIVEMGAHPKADRLTLCQVNVGEGQLRQIVCGAKNHRQGDKVVAALPGAVLPGDFAIKESKIREVESRGMLCSEVELGMSKEGEGILILPNEAPVGKSFAEFYGLNDVVIDVNVTPNRADCLSHLGLAREVGCLLGRSVKPPQITLNGKAEFTKKSIDLQLKEPTLCPRYGGRSVRNVKVGPSPDWLKRRLRSVDMNSINNVVDITNFVMLELGQPLHAFDKRFLKGAKIIVARATKNEEFESFDGTKYRLSDELTIRDGERAVALAGIVGGKNSGVLDDTTELFIESAHFAPESVRRTSRRLNIQTDSAYRFSRGTDPEMVPVALNRACELLEKWAGGEAASDFYDQYPNPIHRESILISDRDVTERLGYAVSTTDLSNVLKQLGCKVKPQATGLSVEPPPYRWDLEQKEDLIEEFARLKGYDLIPETFPPLSTPPIAHAKSFVLESIVTRHLVAEGFQQAINYGFVSSREQARILGNIELFKPGGIDLPLAPVKIRNPLNEEMDVMRTSLLLGLLKNVLRNYHHGREFGRLFEIGQVFEARQEKTQTGNQFTQSTRLGLVGWGQVQGIWNQDLARAVVYDLKTAVENLLAHLKITSFQWQTAKVAPELFHPVQAAILMCEGRAIGWLGSLHPAILENEKVRTSVALAEFDFEKLMRGQPRGMRFEKLSVHPSVSRDLALVMADDLPAADIVREIKKAGGPLLKSVEVFDVFKGESVGAGFKSVAFRLTLQSPDATLTEAQIQGLFADVVTKVSQKFTLKVR
jgi:phenylalanyl-tRNA synthetase beta chain